MDPVVAQAVGQITDVVVKLAVAGAVVVIGKIGDKVAQFIANKAGEQKFQRELSYARHAWDIVEEYARTHPEFEKTIESTTQMFAEEFEQLIPKKWVSIITPDEIKQLQQAIAGEVNKGRSIILKSVK